jgi:hypothetical protein
MKIKIPDHENELKFFNIMIHVDKGRILGRPNNIFDISESSYETLLINGVKMEKVQS